MRVRALAFALALALGPAAAARAERPAPTQTEQTAAAPSPLEAARQQFEAGSYAAAIRTLQSAATAHPQDASLYFWMGRSYFEMKDFDDASGQLERAVKLDPNSAEYHDWLGRAYGRDADKNRSFWLARKSRQQFEEAVQLDPRNIRARRDLMEFYASAPWILGGSREKAREQVAAITTLDPVEGALAEAEFYKDTKRRDQAAPYYGKILAWKPHRIEPYFEAAEYYSRGHDTAQMKEAIDLAAAINSSDPRLPYYRGVLGVLEGNFSDAETYLKAYLARTPQRSDYPSHGLARMWLGILYEKTGKRLEAAEQFRAALRLEPDLEYAKQSLQRLEKRSN
jgi:tetratricopeptide (TPR) repeat protein